MDDGEALGLREPPAVDGLELGEVRREGDLLVPVMGALLETGQELLSGSAPVRGAGEEEELLPVLESEQGPDGVEMGQPAHVLDALTARGTGTAEDQLADELRFVLRDHLSHVGRLLSEGLGVPEVPRQGHFCALRRRQPRGRRSSRHAGRWHRGRALDGLSSARSSSKGAPAESPPH